METVITIIDQEIHEREETIARWQLSRRMGSAAAVIIMEKLTGEMLLLEKIKTKIEQAIEQETHDREEQPNG